MRLLPMVLFGWLLAGPLAAQDSVITIRLPKLRRQANVISHAEIEQIRNQARNAFEVVSRLRAQFLKNRVRGDAIGTADWGRGPQVVLDDSPYGGVETLRNIEVDAIEEIRYVSGTDAAVRYGPEYHGGAIVVLTRH
jgi:hypothetical protein